jgi:hypothetical protein
MNVFLVCLTITLSFLFILWMATIFSNREALIKLSSLTKEREKILDKDYNDIKADILQKQIETLIKENFEWIPIDVIIETYTKLGRCPSILYDDNGFFCVCEDGAQDSPVSFEDEERNEKLVENMSFFIQNKEKWKPTIREAVDFWLFNED